MIIGSVYVLYFYIQSLWNDFSTRVFITRKTLHSNKLQCVTSIQNHNILWRLKNKLLHRKALKKNAIILKRIYHVEVTIKSLFVVVSSKNIFKGNSEMLGSSPDRILMFIYKRTIQIMIILWFEMCVVSHKLLYICFVYSSLFEIILYESQNWTYY